MCACLSALRFFSIFCCTVWVKRNERSTKLCALSCPTLPLCFPHCTETRKDVYLISSNHAARVKRIRNCVPLLVPLCLSVVRTVLKHAKTCTLSRPLPLPYLPIEKVAKMLEAQERAANGEEPETPSEDGAAPAAARGADGKPQVILPHPCARLLRHNLQLSLRAIIVRLSHFFFRR